LRNRPYGDCRVQLSSILVIQENTFRRAIEVVILPISQRPKKGREGRGAEDKRKRN
jgi:hypothetical protein